MRNGLGVRPPLKWAGGKRWLVPHLKPLLAAYPQSRLVEPFCGGLAVTLGVLPEQALLNDINPHAINFYQWLQKGFNPKLDMRNEETSEERKIQAGIVIATDGSASAIRQEFLKIPRFNFSRSNSSRFPFSLIRTGVVASGRS